MSFELDLRAFIDKAKGNAETVVRKVGIDMLAGVIDRSPVGNPELWAINATAREYNAAVDAYNAELRTKPENLTRNGRLKRGLKLHDGMDYAPTHGYVGGRFRGNWQVTFNAEAVGESGRIDPKSSQTLNAGIATLNGFQAGINSIWISNQVPYAVPLEYGHSDQAPNGVVRVTMVEVDRFVRDAVQELDK